MAQHILRLCESGRERAGTAEESVEFGTSGLWQVECDQDRGGEIAWKTTSEMDERLDTAGRGPDRYNVMMIQRRLLKVSSDRNSLLSVKFPAGSKNIGCREDC
jgi:hypothetical protein